VRRERVDVDHGLTGTNLDRPGLREALAACREGDTLVVTELDRLARSLPDARETLDALARRAVKLSLGGSAHDPTDPVGRLLSNVLAMVAELEADLIRLRTREGGRVATSRPLAPLVSPGDAVDRRTDDGEEVLEFADVRSLARSRWMRWAPCAELTGRPPWSGRCPQQCGGVQLGDFEQRRLEVGCP
jgi:DNA invertase Pin-like site-specific DNA recombinase